MDIKRIIKEYYEQLYANEFYNLGEMDWFFEIYNLPKLTEEETDNRNSPISIKEIESMVNNFPKQKAPVLDGFTGEFYQTFREELTPILLKFFQKIAEEGTLPNSFYEATITLIPKPDNGITRKENYWPKSLMNIFEKSSTKYLQIKSNNLQKELYTMTKSHLSRVCKTGSAFKNQLM